jgi:hypothetical protein
MTENVADAFFLKHVHGKNQVKQVETSSLSKTS